MAVKKPLKITDRRRQADPAKIVPYMKPGQFQSYLSGISGLGHPQNGMGNFNDRRNA